MRSPRSVVRGPRSEHHEHCKCIQDLSSRSRKPVDAISMRRRLRQLPESIRSALRVYDSRLPNRKQDGEQSVVESLGPALHVSKFQIVTTDLHAQFQIHAPQFCWAWRLRGFFDDRNSCGSIDPRTSTSEILHRQAATSFFAWCLHSTRTDSLDCRLARARQTASAFSSASA